MDVIAGRKIASVCVIASIIILAPLFTLFESSFSAHMVLHLVLTDALAPSLVAAAFFLWAIPNLIRHKLLDRLLPLERAYSMLSRPIVAFSLATIVLWFSHIPAIFNATLTNDFFHVLVHAGLIITALFYWQPLANSAGRAPYLESNESRMLYLMAGAFQGAVLASIIVFSSQVLFTNYLRVLSYSDALIDQQFGGAIMLLSGPVVYGLAAAFTLRK